MFPNFQFSLHELANLSAMMSERNIQRNQGPAAGRKMTKLSFLAGVLEVDGPDVVELKRGPDAGMEVALLKLIVGDDRGSIIKITAWRQTAEEWAGSDEANHPAIKKGDIVCFKSQISFPALCSPNVLTSRMCFLKMCGFARLLPRFQRSLQIPKYIHLMKFAIGLYPSSLQIVASPQTCDLVREMRRCDGLPIWRCGWRG
jgi:hypothetical protein